MPSDTRIPRIIRSVFLLLWAFCLRSSHGWTADGWLCRLPNRYTATLNHRSIVLSVACNADTVTIPAAGIPRELEELGLFESLICDGTMPHHASPGSRELCGRTVERVSMDPPIFILRKAITPDECRHIRGVASSMETTMEEGKTVSDAEGATPDQEQREQPRKHSRVGWLENDRPSIEAIARRAHGIFLNGIPFHSTRGIEPLQVVHYHGLGGEYVNHHDGNGRLLTVLYYLNGVGATWFPLARYDATECHGVEIRDLTEARRASIGKSPDTSGVLITCRNHDVKDESKGTDGSPIVARVNEGDAVAFYNYRVDGSMNWRAFHSGLPITQDDLLVGKENEETDKNTGGKWIANHFYHFVPSHIPETPPPNCAATSTPP